ncbi:uncharacterized protein TNCV_16601 [Trichonephila clavipes]|nr:uncharacterized protein TNCV_16601 [Trichonephila clavipes]
MVSWEYLWPTLRCRRVPGVSPLLSIGWWYLSSVSPKRHCCRVSAADKECRVYPLNPRPDAVTLYSGCTLDSPLIVTPHRTLNSCRGVISESDLLCASETEILEGLSDQGVTQTRTNLSISTPDISTSSSSTQVQLLPSTSSISISNSESQPPIPTSNDAPSNNMFPLLNHLPQSILTFSSQSVIQLPSDSNKVQDAKKIAKARSRKRKKELLKK